MYFRDFDERTGSSYPGLGDPESALRAFGFGFPDSRGFGFGMPESGIKTFSYSQSSKTIRRPDGSVEMEERSRFVCFKGYVRTSKKG